MARAIAIPATVPMTLAAYAIEVYQRYISPRKGFRCAHRALHGRASCSEFARRMVLRRGIAAMVLSIRKRFAACACAAKSLAAKRKRTKNRTSFLDGVDCTPG